MTYDISTAALGVYSEVGRLRKVLVRAPGLAVLAVLAAVVAGPAASAVGEASAGAGLGAIAPAVASAAAPGAGADTAAGFSQSVLFTARADPRYACFRIPSLVRTVRGTLLAFAEGRKLNCGDATDTDVVLRRSFDGGRTWTPLQVVDPGGGETHGNPEPVVDRTTGRVYLATTYNAATQGGVPCATPCDRTPHMRHSDDDGATWSRPVDLTASIRDPAWNSWYATGPNHGIQLTSGPHPGRLVLGVNAESYADGRTTANYAALVHSDDHGATWHLGATDRWPVSPEDGTFRQKPSELAMVQRADGSLYIGGREEAGTDLGTRDYAVSTDGGDSFARPFSTVPDLYAPGVEGSLLRLGDRLLLASPADPARRRTMEIRASYDDGRTWEAVDQGRIVTTDWSGYSDLVRVPGGTTGLLYEGGAVSATDEIRFARFTDDWLGAPPAPYARTRDLAPGAPDAYVLGGARTVPGVFGDALSFDGADDAVRLPYRHQLTLGKRDFTISLWVRASSGVPVRGVLPLLSMGGAGPHQPQVTLGVEPAGTADGNGNADLGGSPGRIVGTVMTQDGPAPVAPASAALGVPYGDGRWHFVALRRAGGTLTLTVDDRSTSVAGVAGSVSETSPFGVHIGQSVDSRSRFAGDLDEVRVYARALTGRQLAALRAFNVPASALSLSPGPSPVLRLPFDSVRAGNR
ncbi:exo-alpha-sialidase [Streptomyces sp. DW26H14]|uniref:exo-alpha-sialidase n=1 Tax=Streptomyces sp. DW26H14 TaxID=3435395 RepID=UPI00403DC8D2